MLDTSPCPRCGELVNFTIDQVPYRLATIAVVHCRSCDHMVTAPAIAGDHWADKALEQWNEPNNQ